MTVSLLVAGCVATPSPTTHLRPLETALLDPIDVVAAAAERGEAEAQYAYSIVLRQGLRGLAPDPRAADLWRERALAPRGVTPITQYVPAFNGAPSRVHIINLPRYELSRSAALSLEACVASIELEVATPEHLRYCGGPADYARLKALWTATR